METFAADGGVQPHSQPHQKADCSADQKSDGQVPSILDSRVLSYRVEELHPQHRLSCSVSTRHFFLRRPPVYSGSILKLSINFTAL